MDSYAPWPSVPPPRANGEAPRRGASPIRAPFLSRTTSEARVRAASAVHRNNLWQRHKKLILSIGIAAVVVVAAAVVLSVTGPKPAKTARNVVDTLKILGIKSVETLVAEPKTVKVENMFTAGLAQKTTTAVAVTVKGNATLLLEAMFLAGFTNVKLVSRGADLAHTLSFVATTWRPHLSPTMVFALAQQLGHARDDYIVNVPAMTALTLQADDTTPTAFHFTAVAPEGEHTSPFGGLYNPPGKTLPAAIVAASEDAVDLNELNGATVYTKFAVRAGQVVTLRGGITPQGYIVLTI